MPLPLIIAGQVILHGIRIVGLRVIPYIIREGTRIAAKQATKQAVKKVGTKKITESGFVIVTKDPTKFKLAQKIFGKNKVFRNENILQAQSTANKEIVPITQKILKSASPEVRTTILNQADDAANGVSKFISSSKVQTVGGTKIAKPFTDFFGKNLKFSKNTTEAIKIAERGPASLSKEIIKVTPKPGVTVGAPKTILETTKKIIKPTLKSGKEIVPQITKTTKPPWYVSVMPKFLRTTKDIKYTPPQKIPYTGAPYGIRTVTEGVAKGKLAATVAGVYGTGVALDKLSKSTIPVQAEKGIEIDISELFGGKPDIYKQQELTSGTDFYDTDETGNVIQAQ